MATGIVFDFCILTMIAKQMEIHFSPPVDGKEFHEIAKTINHREVHQSQRRF